MFKEFSMLKKKHHFNFQSVKSIYFGGGTPSRLTIEEISVLLNWIRTPVKDFLKVETSIEINPEDASPGFFLQLKEIGFTRISLGVQSFDHSALKTLGRIHNSVQARDAVRFLQDARFKNFNLDLMFGFPGYTLDMLLSDLAQLIDLNPTHISAYCLNIEPKTAAYRKSRWHRWVSENETLITKMYETIVQFLAENGLQQYEVSNFAKTGYQSQQNMVYWQGQNYLGIGMGAHSYLQPYRWGNYKRWVDYKHALQDGCMPFQNYEQLTRFQQRDERLMIGLRLKQGIDLDKFKIEFPLTLPDKWHQKIDRMIDAGYISLKGNRLALTTKGMLLADEISAILAASLP